MAHWDYAQDGDVYSDLGVSEIIHLVRNGILKGDTPVRVTGAEAWEPLSGTFFWAEKPEQPVHHDIPIMSKNKWADMYRGWLILMCISSAYLIYQADRYNPEGTGLYNPSEATMLAVAWLKVAAATMGWVVTSIAFAVGIINTRVREASHINRAGQIAIIDEMRRNQRPSHGRKDSLTEMRPGP